MKDKNEGKKWMNKENCMKERTVNGVCMNWKINKKETKNEWKKKENCLKERTVNQVCMN